MSVPVEAEILTFNDGLITSQSPLGNRGLVKMDNVYLSRGDRGGLEAADGFTGKVDISGGVQLQSGGYFKSQTTGDDLLVVTGGARVYEINVGTGAETAIKSSLTSNERFGITALEDVLCFFNGNDTPFKSTIESSPTVSDIGLTRIDVSGASSALGSTGEVYGTVRYFVASINGVIEGPISKPFGKIDAQDGNEVDLSSVPVSSTGVVRLYRTFADGVNPYYVDTLTGTASGTVSYTDILPDRQLGNPPFAHGDPPKSSFRYAVTHRERIFVIQDDTSKVFWSDLNEPESYYIPGDTDSDIDTFGNFINVFGEDGDRLTAITRASDGLLLFKTNHLYRLRGRFPDEFVVDEITLSDQSQRSVGVATQSMVTASPGAIYFIYEAGLYRYANGVLRYISRDIEDTLDDWTRPGSSVGETFGLGYWRKRNWICYSAQIGANPQGQAYPNTTFFYDINRDQWVGSWDRGFKFFVELEDEGNNEVEFWGLGGSAAIGGDGRGKGYHFDGSDTFDSNAIATDAQLPPLYGGNPHAMKRWLYVDVYFEPKASGDFDIVTEIDGKSSSTTTTTVSQVESNTDLHQRRVNIGLIGRELQLSIQSNADQPRWKVLGMTVAYQTLTAKSQ